MDAVRASKPRLRCDVCGKFRKEEYVKLMADTSSDGFNIDQWIECKECMSLVDRERYFKIEPQGEGE